MASRSDVQITFVHYPGRIARLDAARAGLGPTEFLAGAIELERAGHETAHFEVDPGAAVGRLAGLVGRASGRGHLPPHLGGAVLAGTHALLPELRRADVVVATTTGTAMALATWRRAGLLGRPLVGIVAGLLNRPWSGSRRLTTLQLLRRMHVVLYGDGELGGLLDLDRRLAGRVHVDRFGVDTSYWAPADVAVGSEVVAIGNDGHRDWETLLRAAMEIPVPVRIFTSHRRPATLPPNVSWEKADWYRQVLADGEVRELYRRAAVVVVPVRDVPQPSGQSVALQAMACGRPVVLTRTRGFWAPGTLHDGEDVLFVPPADPAALAAAVRRLLEAPELAARIGARARAVAETDGAIEGFAARLEGICRAAIAGP